MIIPYVNDVKGTQDLSYIVSRNVKWRQFGNTYNTNSEIKMTRKWVYNNFHKNGQNSRYKNIHSNTVYNRNRKQKLNWKPSKCSTIGNLYIGGNQVYICLYV